MISETDRRRQEADLRLLETMNENDQRVAERMGEIRAMNVSTPRTQLLRLHLTAMKASLRSGNKKDRILFVTGESNAGKSRLIENAIAADSAFARYQDDYGWATPLVLTDAPSPCTQRNFGSEILKALGFPARARLKESDVWPVVREQIQAHRVRFLVIDEAQRTMKLKDQGELRKLSDSLIKLVDDKVWPIRIILIGVDTLITLRDQPDHQMYNRSQMISLGVISEKKLQRIELWLNEIIREHAGLGMPDIDVAETAKRLRHACDGNAGSIIELIRAAVEQAVKARRSNLIPADFAQAYADQSGCSAQDNLFETGLWEAIPPGAAKVIKTDDEGEGEQPVELKPLKPGERPR